MPLFGNRRKPDPTAVQLPAVERFLPGDAPRGFRATRTIFATRADGRRIFRTGTGVSLVSQAEAEALAADRARRHLDLATANQPAALDAYAYAVDRQLEPVVDTLRGSAGEELARVTLNSYGALVMNARSMLFADVDGRPDESRLEDAVRDDPALAFRVYRTPAGSRYLCTSRWFDPVSPETATLLQRLDSDPKYALLCRIQRCFRARLTPKPWRAGQRPDRIVQSAAAGVARGELDRFLGKMSAYAAVHFVRSVGDAPTLSELLPLIDYHDRWSQAMADRELA